MGAGSRWSWGAVSGSGSETLVFIPFFAIPMYLHINFAYSSAILHTYMYIYKFYISIYKI